jgi:hypothetical protein
VTSGGTTTTTTAIAVFPAPGTRRFVDEAGRVGFHSSRRDYA